MAEVMRELGWNNNDGKPTKVGEKAERVWRKGEDWKRTRLIARWDVEIARFSLQAVHVNPDPPF